MRVFCREHQKSFFAPRQSPIKCENRGHVIGKLDFDGEANAAYDFQWQYCCNCEHFCIVHFDENGLQHCPVCTRRSSAVFICDRCFTTSFESNTPLQTKNFTLSSDGIPQPCCPGCLRPASADLYEHACEEARTTFVTGLTECPLCGDRLDVGPSFPSAVAQYLRRTKTANKAFVTFDYESGQFVRVDDGEFVLIRIKQETDKSIVIPRAPRLESRRDFYELYQDYYYCAAPEAGELHIYEPAVVVQTPEGWKLLSRGTCAVVDDRPKTKPLPLEKPQSIHTSNPPKAKQLTVTGDEATARCSQCDAEVDAKYAYCWHCGHPRNDTKEPVSARGSHRVASRLIVPAGDDDNDDNEEAQTVQHEPRSIFSRQPSWGAQPTPDKDPSQSRSVLKLFGIIVAGLFIGSLGLYALWPSSSTATSATPTQVTSPAPEEATQSNPEPAPTVATKQAPQTTVSAEDSELARLRQIRTTSSSSDQTKILKDFSETERKYKDDYRFPYERAKVVVMDHKKNAHVKAFAVLARAAQKAINSGKAKEMLQSLNKDSNGDFQTLSHGHREWEQLQKALKTKDASVLSENQGL